MLQLLLSHSAMAAVDDRTVAQHVFAHALQENCPPIVDFLLHGWEEHLVTDDSLVIAAGNSEKGTVQRLLDSANLRRTLKVLTAAATNQNDGLDLLTYLLEEYADLITEDMVKAAAGNARFGIDLLELFAQRQSISLKQDGCRRNSSNGVAQLHRISPGTAKDGLRVYARYPCICCTKSRGEDMR
ncbi:hypothetical protein BJX70DRAFT_151012 [Aspergillus crustosus]